MRPAQRSPTDRLVWSVVGMPVGTLLVCAGAKQDTLHEKTSHQCIYEGFTVWPLWRR